MNFVSNVAMHWHLGGVPCRTTNIPSLQKQRNPNAAKSEILDRNISKHLLVEVLLQLRLAVADSQLIETKLFSRSSANFMLLEKRQLHTAKYHISDVDSAIPVG